MLLADKRNPHSGHFLSLARLAPRRQQLWMDGRGDRLRQALDRKHPVAAAPIRATLLADTTEHSKSRWLAGGTWGPLKKLPCQTQEVTGNQQFSDRGEKVQTHKSFRISKATCKNGSAQPQTRRAQG